LSAPLVPPPLLYLFGSPTAFFSIATPLDVLVLGELPLVKGVSVGGDNGMPYVLTSSKEQGEEDNADGVVWRDVVQELAGTEWQALKEK